MYHFIQNLKVIVTVSSRSIFYYYDGMEGGVPNQIVLPNLDIRGNIIY